jgi:hypothetical protein
MIHALQPLGAVFPTLANVFVTVTPDRPNIRHPRALAALVAQCGPTDEAESKAHTTPAPAEPVTAGPAAI